MGRLTKRKKSRSGTYNLSIETLWKFGLKKYISIKIRGCTNKGLREEIVRKLSSILLKSNIVELVVTPSKYYESLNLIDTNVDLYVKLIDEFGNMQSRGFI